MFLDHLTHGGKEYVGRDRGGGWKRSPRCGKSLHMMMHTLVHVPWDRCRDHNPKVKDLALIFTCVEYRPTTTEPGRRRGGIPMSRFNVGS